MTGLDLDLSRARAAALAAAQEWGVELGEPFALSNASYVARAGDACVVKAPWEGDDESLHEGEALELWDGDGAVRLLRRRGRVLLLERAVPGDDLSALREDEATAVAVELATRLWRPAQQPFRPVVPEVERWLHEEDGPLAPLARQLLAELDPGADWVVHGDYHHHNVLRGGDAFLAIDPKPYLADREYDVPSFLWNPLDNRFDDRGETERRIAAFAAAGLDEWRIRAWTAIRGAYLRPELADRLRALL